MKNYWFVALILLASICNVQAQNLNSNTSQSPKICKPFDAFVDNNDGTVTDPRDGLVWKRCAEDFEFNGQNCIMKGNAVFGRRWNEAMKAARESRFLGKSDWRLPTFDELKKVVDLNCQHDQVRNRVYAASNMIAHPMEDDNFSRGEFWSSTIDEHGRSLVVSFYYGRVSWLEKKDWAIHRLVRDTRAEQNQQAEKQRLKQAEVKSFFVDDRTGLMWRRCTIGLLWDEQKRICFGNKEERASWLEVVKLAAEDRLGGFNDWRLPTETEFISLVKDKKYEYCSDVLRRVDSLFPIGSVEGNLWLLDNTDDYQNPTAGRLKIYKDDCNLTNQSYRPFAKFSSILVRGGTVPNEWKNAIMKTGSAQEVNNIARQKNAEYWQDVNSKVTGFLSQSGAAVEQKSGGNNWTVESTKKVSAVNWFAETYVKCTGSRNRGESFKILHLDNGRYQSVTGPIETTLNKVANFHCN